jgi:chromate reductase, NAD(P)H dehydrogenase (quinone)
LPNLRPAKINDRLKKPGTLRRLVRYSPKSLALTNMYSIISGTNRKDSNTIRIAQYYRDQLSDLGISARLISLEDLYVQERTLIWEALETETLIPTTKYIIVSPEYNGSIPGVLKCFMDISDIRQVWWGKKALLVGVSTGRAGNLRGMEDLTGILHYLKVHVYPNKLPISSVDKLVDKQTGLLTDAPTKEAIKNQLNEFIQY